MLSNSGLATFFPLDLRLRRMKINAPMMIATPKMTPIAMPAFAPELIPLLRGATGRGVFDPVFSGIPAIAVEDEDVLLVLNPLTSCERFCELICEEVVVPRVPVDGVGDASGRSGVAVVTRVGPELRVLERKVAVIVDGAGVGPTGVGLAAAALPVIANGPEKFSSVPCVIWNA